MNATLTISLDDYNKLVAARREAEAEAAAAREELRNAKIAAADATMLALTRDALTIVRFAVAHLAPETIRGWPHASLTRVANALPTLPDATVDDRDMAIDLLAFAREAAVLEKRRAGIGLTPAERATIAAVE